MQRILRRIKPTPGEEKELIRVAGELLKLVEGRAQKEDPRISARVVGSSSRNTWLRHEKDLDIFVLFPLEYEKAQMEEIVTRIGRGTLEEPQRRYAEHPYIMGRFSGFDVEIVPCYTVESPSGIKSAVDRTPFHEEFVKKNITGKEDDVRLLKQFLKGIECYGAEAKTEGISGYLAELFIIKHGSFIEVLKQAAGWRGSVVIQIGSEYPERELRKKFREPMIFVDPVDRNRNVASALSADKFNRIIYAAKEYLKNPGDRFFSPRQRTARPDDVTAKSAERKTSLIALVSPRPDVVDDILYPQMRKAQAAIVKLLKSMDFRVLGATFFLRKHGCIFIELESMGIPNLKLHQGPYANSEHEERFLEKHAKNSRKLSRPFIRGERWYIYLKRQYADASSFLMEFIKQGHLEEKGIPSYVAESLEDERTEIRVNADAISAEFASDILEYFEPRFPWER
ncbi:MAG: CCA tRNA nucleotidyltransferase [Candidatus Hydrothermarchaeaceae archaeon]